MTLRTVALRAMAIAIALLSLFLSAVPAAAQQFPAEHVRVQLVSEMESVRPGEPFWVGMHFQIDPDWHIYWRNPGDSGAAPTVDWVSDPGIDIGEFVWPYPERMPAGPLLNFGYEDEVLLMMQAELPESYEAREVTLQGDALWLVCNAACIPEEASVELTLPVGGGAIASLQAPLFQQTRQNLPRPSPWPIRAEATSDRLALYVESPELAAATIDRVSFFPDVDGVIVNAAEQAIAIGNEGFSLDVQRGYIPELDSVSGVLTISERVGGESLTQAFEFEAPVELVPELAAVPAIALAPASASLWSAFGLAFLGGIVLNVMPCVFPVLSLKALGILREAGQHPQRVRTRSLWYAAGISVSVLTISAGVLLLRSLGQQVGWGFQLQAPGFVLVMAYLMFAVGLNFSGVFEIGGAFVGMGQKLTERSGYWGDFFTGIFATVVATPCSAPFMATAIGVALAQPGWVAIAIFQMLGLGLALPYVVISFVPAIQSRLPKPGAWMTVARQALAFPMYAAAAWLIWVLTQQTGSPGLAVGLSGLLAIAFAAWTFRVTRAAGKWNQRAGAIAASIAVGMAIAIAQIPTPVAPPSEIAAEMNAIAWEPYSAETLANYRREERPVFVNFAADWCITCLVNDRVVLSQPDIRAAFAANNVVSLKGDWTNRNSAITEALAEFGRGGVPLYVFYPPDADPVVLPQILSSDRLHQVITQSG